MAEASCKVWLNWEMFEVAAINQLFTSDISMDKIEQFSKTFDSIEDLVSQKEWIDRSVLIFRLGQEQLKYIYRLLVAFVVRDPTESLMTSTALEQQEYENIKQIRCSDILCFLYAIFVKKKHRNVSEVSQLEQFPGKKESERLSPRQRVFSSSTPTVGARLQIQPQKSETSHFNLMVRFFVTRLTGLLNILAPDGQISPVILSSLDLLLHCGHNFQVRVPSLNQFYPSGIETAKFLLQVTACLLPKDSTDLFSPKVDAPQSSPLTYRPALASRDPTSPRSGSAIGQRGDRPKCLADMTGAQIFEVPTGCPDVHIHNSKHSRFYFCGVVSSLFVSHCKDSIVFVGCATGSVHLEYCANVTIICASKNIHFDTCTRCTGYLLVNNRPLMTGTCSKLTLAPYNALYSKFGADVLAGGVNPGVNRWREPLSFGTLGHAPAAVMPPAQFSLFVVPFVWQRATMMISPPVPVEYATALEERKGTLLVLQQNIERIRAVKPELADKIVDKLKGNASKWIQDVGHQSELVWLNTL